MSIYNVIAQLGRLLTEFAEREIERREQAPEPLIVQIKAAWGSQQTRRVA